MNDLTKKGLIFALVMAVVAGVGWYGRKAYKSATEQRLVTEARQYLQGKDPRNAALCLQRALQVNPMSLDAARMMADMLEGAGTPAALSWRIRAAQLEPAQTQLRFDWAKTALKMQDLRSATNALAGVDQSGRATATYHKLAGALNWSLNKSDEAERQYTEALRLEPGNQLVELNLATIHLASTNAAVANAARLAMSQMAASADLELRLTALHLLAADAQAHKSFDAAIGYSKQLVQDPSSSFKDKIGHLQLLLEAGSDEFGPWLTALKQEAAPSPAPAFLLGEWLLARENPSTALNWLPEPPRPGSDQPARPADHRGLQDCAQRLVRPAGADWQGGLGRVELLSAGAGVPGATFPGPRRRGVNRVAKGPSPVRAPAGPVVTPGASGRGFSMDHRTHGSPA